MTQFEAALRLHREGRLDEAAEAYNSILVVDPSNFDAAYHFSVLRAGQGRFDEALALVEFAGGARPGSWQAQAHKGALLLVLRRFEEGLDELRQAFALEPTRPEIANNIGAALRYLGRIDEARSYFERALQLAPQYREALKNLSATLIALGDYDTGTKYLREVIAQSPHSAQLYDELGAAYMNGGRLEDAIGAFRKAIATDGRYLPSWSHLGNALVEQGAIADACACFLQAIEAFPERPQFYRLLAEIDAAALAPKVEHLVRLSSSHLADDEQADLHFALANIYQSMGDVAQSFGHYIAGNDRMRARQPYDEREVLSALERQSSTFSASHVLNFSGCGYSDETPVFIFGMPRSGTTLVEQLLASHPQVYAAGEFSFFGDFARSVFGGEAPVTLDRGAYDLQLLELGRRYVAALRSRGGENVLRITDKTPANFQYVGLIHLALPNAKLIHVRRDGLDTCFSCFTHTFLGTGMGWTNDLAHIGRYYRAYLSFMKHWRDVMPPQAMLEVDYEDLVSDFETQVRRILTYCRIPWDDRCLEFYKAKRSVKTASAVQVRKPLYRSSVGRAQTYAEFLEPLHTAIGDVTPLLPPAPRPATPPSRSNLSAVPPAVSP